MIDKRNRWTIRSHDLVILSNVEIVKTRLCIFLNSIHGLGLQQEWNCAVNKTSFLLMVDLNKGRNEVPDESTSFKGRTLRSFVYSATIPNEAILDGLGSSFVCVQVRGNC